MDSPELHKHINKNKETAGVALAPQSISSSYNLDSIEAQDYEGWVHAFWNQLRNNPRIQNSGAILCLDEVQIIPNYTKVLKGNWDRDRQANTPIQVIILGSSPLRMQRKIKESLKGRYTIIQSPHWEYTEMSEAFGYTLDDYIFYGGYPGLAADKKVGDLEQWLIQVEEMIDATLEKDIVHICDIERPHLVKSFFELCIKNSSKVMNLENFLTPLNIESEKHNIHTLQDFLDAFEATRTVVALNCYRKTDIQIRSNKPKLLALNTAFMSAYKKSSFLAAHSDKPYWGHLVETAVGAYLWNHKPKDGKLFYWRDNKNIHEVDYVLKYGDKIVAFEVKSQTAAKNLPSVKYFHKHFNVKPHIIAKEGGDITLEEFFAKPVASWLEE